VSTDPIKYDDEVTWVLERTRASGVVLIVVGGDRGEGFALQATRKVTPRLPMVLRDIADQIEKDLKIMSTADWAQND
jgi:hypothetical protein